MDQLEEERLVPERKVLYQFSARGHDLAQVMLGSRLTDRHDGAGAADVDLLKDLQEKTKAGCPFCAAAEKGTRVGPGEFAWHELATTVTAEVIQVIGKTITLYRPNPEIKGKAGDTPPWRR